MAVFRFKESGQPDRPAITKRAAYRLLDARDAEIEKWKQKSHDHLMLAERWGSKAAEFERVVIELQQERKYLFAALGVSIICSFLGVVF